MKIYFRKFINCFVLLFCLIICFSHLVSNAQNLVLFDHLTVSKGLSQNSGIAIGQDKQGFIWIGTRYGLNRYDGYRFKIYQNTDSSGLKDNYIHAIHSDRQGLLWIGTEAGLHWYDLMNDQIRRISDRYASFARGSNMIIHIFEDKSGRLWISTEYGLKLLAKNKKEYEYTFLMNNSGLPSNNVRCCYQDSKGNLWVGTANGLSKITFNNNKPVFENFKNNSKPDDISDNYVTSITEDKDKNLWIATQNGGLNLYCPPTNNFVVFKHSENSKSIISNVIRKIETDESGKLWIGTLDGLSIMDTKSHECVSYQYEAGNNKSLSQNSVYSIFKDKNGSMWVGTYYGGVNVSYPYITQFKMYHKERYQPSINNNIISSIVQDKNKNIWIGTEGGGVNFFDRKTGAFSAYTNRAGLSAGLRSNLVKCLFLDRKDNLWIGTHGGGLNLFETETKTFKRFLFDPLSPKSLLEEVNAIMEDTDGTLWIGTQKSGIVVSNARRTEFRPLNLPALNRKIKGIAVTNLLKNGDEVWIGTYYGLFVLNRKKNVLVSFKSSRSNAKNLKSLSINCIAKTRDGKIWLGTYYGGLSCYDREKNAFISYNIDNGLPNNNVLGILEDESGNLWVSTSNGLSVFNRRLKSFKNYTVSDGLAGNEFNTNAYFKSDDGEMFFGGYDGFISFYPDRIQTNTKRNKIVLTDIKFQNRSIDISEHGNPGNINNLSKVVFKYNQNTFSVDFALLNFIKPQKNHYTYKLDGYESKWNYTNIPTAGYINLPPGSYNLLIKGINNDGFMSGNVKKINIVILPPFYRTWWAYLLYMAIVCVIIILFVRYLLIQAVLKKEKEINVHKLDFFTNISHEIRTPLTLIVGPLGNLIEETSNDLKINRSLLQIKNNADRLMNLVTELLDFRKAESGKMPLQVSAGDIIGFCKEIFLAFQNMAFNKSIDYVFDTSLGYFELYFDKVQLEKVIFNLLSNALKFSPDEGKVIFAITQRNEYIKIDVSNTGRGIPLKDQPDLFNNFYQADKGAKTGTGLGLSLSKALVELHKGKIYFVSITSENGKTGHTCFTVELKTGQSHFLASEIITTASLEDNTEYVADISDNLINDGPASIQSECQYNVLLVEDNDEIRSLIKNALVGSYQVSEAEDGLQGWENAISTLPDLVISDVMMPNMDGLELCRKLKTDERTSHIPVILLTARSAYVHQINGLETGADAYIIKPFNKKILQLNVKNLLKAREILKNRFSQIVTLEPKDLIINTTEQNFLNKVIRIIEDNIDEPDFVVSSLASELGMSKPILYKKLRSLTDLSVNDFIKSIRLKKAARLLEGKHGNISEIAYSVGFTDRKYFSIEFKKMFGKSPSEYVADPVNVINAKMIRE